MRSILLPASDATVGIQFLVVVLAGSAAPIAARRDRDLLLLVVGASMLLLGVMSLRMIH